MMGMIGPRWLADIVGVLMFAATVYAIVRIVGAWRSRTATDYSTEVCYAVMGVSMAGTLIPALHIAAPGVSAWIWLIVQVVMTAYFLFSVIRDLTTQRAEHGGLGLRARHLPHLVLSGAMVYLLAVLNVRTAPSSGGSVRTLKPGMNMAGMHMGTSGAGIVPWATLDLLMALFLIGYSVVLADRLSVIGSIGGVGVPRVWRRPAADAPPRLYAPEGAAALGITMALGMSYMLVMMFA